MPDACNCCQVCAKANLEACGGPYNLQGICGEDLLCLKECPPFEECDLEFEKYWGVGKCQRSDLALTLIKSAPHYFVIDSSQIRKHFGTKVPKCQGSGENLKCQCEQARHVEIRDHGEGCTAG